MKTDWNLRTEFQKGKEFNFNGKFESAFLCTYTLHNSSGIGDPIFLNFLESICIQYGRKIRSQTVLKKISSKLKNWIYKRWWPEKTI